MAGDWIKWQRGLSRKPEVLRMSARLGRSRHEIAALLMEVWEWTDEQVADPDEEGNAIVRIESGQARAFIDHLTGLLGFAEAMSAENWISFRSAHVAFPNWGRHNGKSAKRRALDAERKRSERSDEEKDVRKPSASKADKKRTRGEERREESNTHTQAHAREPTPLESQSLELQKAIAFWNRYWVETHGSGRPCPDTRIDAMLAEARSRGWSEEQICESIRASVAWGAKSWRDPQANHDEIAKARRNGAKPKAEIPITERC